MRSKFRPGYHLVEDEESGLTVWSDEVTKTWDGQIVRKEYADSRHPQSVVGALPRSDPPIMARAAALVTAFSCASSFSTAISGVTAKIGPASHLFYQI